MSILAARIAPTNTMRGRGSASTCGSTGPGSSAGANSSVSATFGPKWTFGFSSRIFVTSSGALAITASARGAKRRSAERKFVGVDPLLGGVVVVDVVQDRGRFENVDQYLRLRHERPEQRFAHAKPAHRPAHVAGQQEPRSSAAAPRWCAAVRRAARARAVRRLRARDGPR